MGIWLSMPAVGQEILLRHAMEGVALDTLSTLVLRFNSEQKRPAMKVVLQEAASVKDKRQLPHLGLLDPEDSLAFFGSRPRFVTLQEVMKKGGEKFDAASILPQMADATDNLVGSLQGLPLALSLPVLFYNKDAFLKAGLDPENPPKTWWEVQRTAGALLDAEFECPLTTS
ncbi:MAG: extracellular solute-binding protein, partial [Rhodocyclaceae bacterium]|nr:extracellular solute-binding protein [Rhodocyclaceae bacterium]